MIDVMQKMNFSEPRKVMSLQVNNTGQNNISTFMNEKYFCQGCDWFLLVLSKKMEE